MSQPRLDWQLEAEIFLFVTTQDFNYFEPMLSSKKENWRGHLLEMKKIYHNVGFERISRYDCIDRNILGMLAWMLCVLTSGLDTHLLECPSPYVM